MILQIDVTNVVEYHRLRRQLAQEQILVLAALPQELLVQFDVEICLEGIHE